MNVRKLHTELWDLPSADDELDVFLEDGRKVIGFDRRDNPGEGPHIVLIVEPGHTDEDSAG